MTVADMIHERPELLQQVVACLQALSQTDVINADIKADHIRVISGRCAKGMA